MRLARLAPSMEKMATGEFPGEGGLVTRRVRFLAEGLSFMSSSTNQDAQRPRTESVVAAC